MYCNLTEWGFGLSYPLIFFTSIEKDLPPKILTICTAQSPPLLWGSTKTCLQFILMSIFFILKPK